MKHMLWLFALAWHAMAGAQAPSGISFDRASAVVNQPVKVTVNFEAASSLCGLRVDFGDGEVRDMLVERFPVTMVKQYVAPGQYAVRAEGRLVLRGLSSALACAGAPRRATLPVARAPGEVATRPRPADTPGADRGDGPPVTTRVPTPVPRPAPDAPAGKPRDESLRVF